LQNTEKKTDTNWTSAFHCNASKISNTYSI